MRVFILFSYLLTYISCMSQEKQVVYLFFDTNNLSLVEQNQAQILLAYENLNNTTNAKGTKTCN